MGCSSRFRRRDAAFVHSKPLPLQGSWLQSFRQGVQGGWVSGFRDLLALTVSAFLGPFRKRKTHMGVSENRGTLIWSPIIIGSLL